MLGECFDPQAGLLIHQHLRPHWSQAGAVVFITFRTADSIPAEVVLRWEAEKQDWLARRGFATGAKSSVIVSKLNSKDQADFQRTFNRCREEYLDTCQGACVLKRPELARAVSDSLLHFDGQRYKMGDFVIMPNHVHLLAVFPTEQAMFDQCDSWMHFTAVQINRALGSQGKFWQSEPFDHLVRTAEQYEYLRQYIADNPLKAQLLPGEYIYRRYPG
ncbi:transposase [Anatilimnocola floriformis]|uniref:transposase n=1 Tax=Anatilimnocola floriformis TaxID=2948575 RepID=UPI0020C2EDCE|nr:transposase [Anatilimnocola floriformis]